MYLNDAYFGIIKLLQNVEGTGFKTDLIKRKEIEQIVARLNVTEFSGLINRLNDYQLELADEKQKKEIMESARFDHSFGNGSIHMYDYYDSEVRSMIRGPIIKNYREEPTKYVIEILKSIE